MMENQIKIPNKLKIVLSIYAVVHLFLLSLLVYKVYDVNKKVSVKKVMPMQYVRDCKCFKSYDSIKKPFKNEIMKMRVNTFLFHYTKIRTNEEK